MATAYLSFLLNRLPDHVSLEEGALCEPIAVGVKTTRRAELQVGQTIFITGAGPIGLINMLVAKYKGASKVIMTGKYRAL